MDKGLDIGALRCLLALHPDCYGERSGRAAATLRDAPGATNPDELVAALSGAGVRADRDYAARALAWAGAPGRHVVTLGDADYPEALRQLAVPPPVLFVCGERALLSAAQLAVVGARRATRAGCAFAERLAADLAAAGLCVTSGLALGIDAAAHRGALAAGGDTLAVLGCGIDRIYPRRHAALAADIAERGAIISEFPLGAQPLPRHFPMRNRVIAGLSLGTVVVEAAARSGSISTAHHALEQGRDVFAVPGSVNNPLARGCHALIRQGARLTESALDVLEELSWESTAPAAAERNAGAAHARGHAPAGSDPATRALLEACAWEPFTIDEIVSRTGLTPQIVSSMLLALELGGRIARQASGIYIRIR